MELPLKSDEFVLENGHYFATRGKVHGVTVCIKSMNFVLKSMNFLLKLTIVMQISRPNLPMSL